MTKPNTINLPALPDNWNRLSSYELEEVNRLMQQRNAELRFCEQQVADRRFKLRCFMLFLRLKAVRRAVKDDSGEWCFLFRRKGFRHIAKLLPEDMKLILVTVGLADVNDQENINNIRNSLKAQVPGTLLNNAQIFHLRGGIDYEKLSFKHRTMMTLLYHKVKNLPEEKKTAEDRAMIETFNSKVDFVDYHSLDQIIEAIR